MADTVTVTDSSSSTSTNCDAATGAVFTISNPPNGVTGENRFVFDPILATSVLPPPTASPPAAVAPTQRPSTTGDTEGTTGPDTNAPGLVINDPDSDDAIALGVNVTVERFRPHTTTVWPPEPGTNAGDGPDGQAAPGTTGPAGSTTTPVTSNAWATTVNPGASGEALTSDVNVSRLPTLTVQEDDTFCVPDADSAVTWNALLEPPS